MMEKKLGEEETNKNSFLLFIPRKKKKKTRAVDHKNQTKTSSFKETDYIIFSLQMFRKRNEEYNRTNYTLLN